MLHYNQTDGKGGLGGVSVGVAVAAALGATLAAGGVAIVVLCARRRRATPPHKHPPGDMLELSDGGRRYVVAYTIKPSPDLKTPDPQPDILNAPGNMLYIWKRNPLKICIAHIMFKALSSTILSIWQAHCEPNGFLLIQSSYIVILCFVYSFEQCFWRKCIGHTNAIKITLQNHIPISKLNMTQ